jgi:riboflavin synthase
MFTGIIEEMGTIVSIVHGQESARVRVRAEKVLADIKQGASVAVDGCCLTAVEFGPEWFEADVMLETLRRTTIGELVVDSHVNLERPVGGVGRLGGHVVQGHVDGQARITRRTPGDRWEEVEFEVSDSLARYLVEKGSVAVDGISLTIVAVSEPMMDAPWFTVSLIPETLTVTTLGRKAVGGVVNIEVDVLAKHVERLLAFKEIRP